MSRPTPANSSATRFRIRSTRARRRRASRIKLAARSQHAEKLRVFVVFAVFGKLKNPLNRAESRNKPLPSPAHGKVCAAQGGGHLFQPGIILTCHFSPAFPASGQRNQVFRATFDHSSTFRNCTVLLATVRNGRRFVREYQGISRVLHGDCRRLLRGHFGDSFVRHDRILRRRVWTKETDTTFMLDKSEGPEFLDAAFPV